MKGHIVEKNQVILAIFLFSLGLQVEFSRVAKHILVIFGLLVAQVVWA